MSISIINNLLASIDLGPTDLPKSGLTSHTLNKGIQTFLGVVASIALLVIVISAFRMVISRGNPQDIAKARDAIIYASIGLVITMTAFGIVTFVLGGL